MLVVWCGLVGFEALGFDLRVLFCVLLVYILFVFGCVLGFVAVLFVWEFGCWVLV